MPLGALGTHAHVIGGGAGHPFVAQRGYTPPPAGVDDFVTMLDIVSLQYAVVVQISVHGSDNGCLWKPCAPNHTACANWGQCSPA